MPAVENEPLLPSRSHSPSRCRLLGSDKVCYSQNSGRSAAQVIATVPANGLPDPLAVWCGAASAASKRCPRGTAVPAAARRPAGHPRRQWAPRWRGSPTSIPPSSATARSRRACDPDTRPAPELSGQLGPISSANRAFLGFLPHVSLPVQGVGMQFVSLLHHETLLSPV
jgi:hypothetical protein